MIDAILLANHGNRMVWIDTTGAPSRVRLSQARRVNATVFQCARCERIAVELDHLAPYHQENNRCRTHGGKS